MSQQVIITNKTSALYADVLFVLKKLDASYFPTPWDFESWNNVFSKENDRLFIVDRCDEIVRGFILFDVNVVDSFAHLLKVVVTPENRGLKIGKNLLNEAIEVLKTRGVVTFFLEVEEDNLIARSLYESIGFKIIHKKNQFYSNGQTAIIMTLTA